MHIGQTTQHRLRRLSGHSTLSSSKAGPSTGEHDPSTSLSALTLQLGHMQIIEDSEMPCKDSLSHVACRGTSEWTAQQIQEAFGVADRLGLIPPSVEQPEYNLLERRKASLEPLYLLAHSSSQSSIQNSPEHLTS